METTIQVLGPQIRQLRLERRLTLEEAAERAGCTPGFLSQVERNQAVPSISMLYAIAQALNVKVAHFFPRVITGAKVVRKDSREVFHFEGSFMVYSLLSANYPDRKIECMLVPVSYTHLRAHETPEHLVCRLLFAKKKNKQQQQLNSNN